MNYGLEASTIEELRALAEDRPCACGKFPNGAGTESAGEMRVEKSGNRTSITCALRCLSCHQVHDFKQIVQKGRNDELRP